MRVFCTSLFVAAAVAALPQIASAQQPGGGQGRRPVNPIVAALDLDGDGTISKEELAKAVESLKKLDKNGDGVLSGDEIRPSFGGGPGAGAPGGGIGARFNPEDMIKRMLEGDKNGDGKLSKDEVSDRMKDRFDSIDTNKDGFLDKDELKAMSERFGQGRPGGGNRPAGGNRQGGNRPAGGARPEAEK